MSWEKIVTDRGERLVFEALDEPDCTWRASDAIAREKNLSETRVMEIVRKYDGKLTRRSDMLSVSGKPLVGLIKNVGPRSPDVSAGLEQQVEAAIAAEKMRIEKMIQAKVDKYIRELT